MGKLRSYRIKSIISGLLLSSYLFISLGVNYQLLLEWYFIRSAVKSSIEQGLPETAFTYLDESSVSVNPQVYWENDHEFYYEGNIYDVVSISNGKIKCYLDSKESIVIQKINDQASKNQQRKHAAQQNVSLNLFYESTENHTCFQTEAVKFVFTYHPVALTDVTSSLFIPPPETV